MIIKKIQDIGKQKMATDFVFTFSKLIREERNQI